MLTLLTKWLMGRKDVKQVAVSTCERHDTTISHFGAALSGLVADVTRCVAILVRSPCYGLRIAPSGLATCNTNGNAILIRYRL